MQCVDCKSLLRSGWSFVLHTAALACCLPSFLPPFFLSLSLEQLINVGFPAVTRVCVIQVQQLKCSNCHSRDLSRGIKTTSSKHKKRKTTAACFIFVLPFLSLFPTINASVTRSNIHSSLQFHGSTAVEEPFTLTASLFHRNSENCSDKSSQRCLHAPV